MAVSPVPGSVVCAPSIAADVRWVPTRGWDVPFLVVLVVAVVVLVLVVRAAAASGRPKGGVRGPRAPRPRPQRPTAPDDDPEFLRELERRTRRDDGSPA
jgi:hypothetical protein